MKNFTRILSILSCLAIGTLEVAAQVAQLPYCNHFNYPVGANLGTQSGWFVTQNAGGTDSVKITAGNLSYPGFAASSGNKVTFDGDGTDAVVNIDSSKLSQTIPGIIYYSFLLKITSIGSTTGIGAVAGFYNNTNNSTLGAPLRYRPDGTSFDLGISERVSSSISWSSTLYLDSTYLIVGAYKFITGASNDSAFLWINPAASAFDAATPPAPTLGAAAAVGATDLAQIARFFIRQDSVTTTPFCQLDELRIGLNWSDVVTKTSTQVDENKTGLAPREMSLEQNYPNPFNPETKIQYAMKSSGHVTLVIYDLLGHEVVTVVDKELAAGTYSSTIDGSHWASGVYFYRMQVETGGKELFQSTKTFLLLK